MSGFDLILSSREKGDFAIYKYYGELDGVACAEAPGDDVPAFSIGFPARFANNWSGTLIPLLSYGFAHRERNRDHGSSFLRSLIGKPPTSLLPRVLFSGAAALGNSGGGLFNLKGELLGIHCCYHETLGEENGLEAFYSPHEVIHALP